MNRATLLSVSLMAALSCLPLAAQTGPPRSRPHARTAEHSAAGCVTPQPVLPAKIPALPPGTSCVKRLFTVTRLPETKLDYVSPLVSERVRESLGGTPLTFSLEYTDVQQGTGEPVTPNRYLTVKYTGYLASDGTKFDSSDDHPGKEPFTFPYGEHHVIPGWDTGFEGMRVGGKRRLYIPWELAYGENGRPPVIPPKAELIFDVEVMGVSDQPPAAPRIPRPPMPPAGVRPQMPGAAAKPQGSSTQPH